MNQTLLPIGTVVELNELEKPIMIIGFYPISNDNAEKLYDYSGCFYPVGLLSSDEALMFNHDSIKKVVFKGLINEDEMKFKEEITKIIKVSQKSEN